MASFVLVADLGPAIAPIDPNKLFPILPLSSSIFGKTNGLLPGITLKLFRGGGIGALRGGRVGTLLNGIF